MASLAPHTLAPLQHLGLGEHNAVKLLVASDLRGEGKIVLVLPAPEQQGDAGNAPQAAIRRGSGLLGGFSGRFSCAASHNAV